MTLPLRLLWSSLGLAAFGLLAAAVAHSTGGPRAALAVAAFGLGAWALLAWSSSGATDGTGTDSAADNDLVSAPPHDPEAWDDLDAVIETMTGALILVDPARRIRRVNRAALELLGYSADELIGEDLDAVCPESEPVNTGSLIQLSTSGRVRNVERVFRHRDGRDLPVLFSGSTLHDGEGRVRAFVCVATDIGPAKQLEAQLRDSLRQKDLLLREVHHRVKNNLQVISSLLDLQSDQIDDPRHLELLRDSRHRIRSMALIHEQLYRHDNLAEVRLSAYLEDLASHLFRSFGVAAGRIVLRCRLEPLTLDLDRSVACGLILNELVSNSLEHAFADDSGGTVEIVLRRLDDGAVRLEVRDDGSGFDPTAPRPHSMGLELVTMMASQLQGTLDTKSDPVSERGTHVSVTFLDGRTP
ncbi:MAG: histidine kinase dimerization/phosphoacceptor domain -containing protein [Acidobacteriota bacterium]